MEKLIIYYTSSKTRKGSNIKKIKEELWKKYFNKNKISIHTLQLDHIIPFCICQDNSINNYQLLNPLEHKEKTKIDFKIIKEFKKIGWIEKITNYSHELKVPICQLKLSYLEMYKKLKLDKLDRLDKYVQ